MKIFNELFPYGRLTRTGFWLRHLTLVPVILWAATATERSDGVPWNMAFTLLLVLVLVSTWGRRLHDRDRSALWLLAVIVPVFGALLLILECASFGRATNGGRHGARPGVRTDDSTVGRLPDQASAKQ